MWYLPYLTNPVPGLLRHKGDYHYDYMDIFDRYDEMKLLSGSACSDAEYTHASRVWTAFGCKKMADYHGINLQLDVLLLVVLFEVSTCISFS